MTLAALEAVMEKELRMDMSDPSSRSRIKQLFIPYVSFVRKNGLNWIAKENPKTGVAHIVSAVKPRQLKTRLETDWQLTYVHLKKDFKEFMKHANFVAKAFQIVGNGPAPRHRNSRTRPDNTANINTSHPGPRSSHSTTHGQTEQDIRKPRSQRPPFPCPHPPCKSEKM
eukprot:gb/GEZJ01002740.1/.p1 GENE.gb/GEZJ01002740.1/~~gb/GEZJ01002740.1/.p1  ORF type:complete len:169 (+),score=12.80 gb/GEZJ01002740.1/:1752-2258(+)